MHKRVTALDLGDRWIGVAISDPLGIVARPYDTIEYKDLIPFLTTLIAQEQLEYIVVGYPQTLRGTQSEQTKKVVNQYKILQSQFPNISWILIDERLTSKQATQMPTKNSSKQKNGAHTDHARAAALILTIYLNKRARESEN